MSASEQTSASKRAINHELETAANVYAHDHGSPVAAYASALHQAFMAGARFMEGQPDELSKAQELVKELENIVDEAIRLIKGCDRNGHFLTGAYWPEQLLKFVDKHD